MKRVLLFLSLLPFLYPAVSASDNYPSHGSIDILHYRFSVYLSDSTDVISGMAGIKVLFNGVAGSLPLDLKSPDGKGKGMVVSRVIVDGREAGWRHEDDRLVIRLGRDFEPGDTASVAVYYSGQPADGLIISSNRYGERTFFADNWPDRARNWIPCVDHPSDKATVEFIVYAPEYYSVVSNGQLFEESSLPGGLRVTHWKEQVEIPTKVMVIGVARFARQKSASYNGTGVWTWVFPEDRENGFLDYSVAVKPLIFFSQVIGPYPYEKLANVQSKTIFGGMENAGCIFYYEKSVTGENRMEGLMAHEISHQWFGNSVTEKDWHHIWLSEGFATYFTAVYLEAEYGEGEMNSEMQKARNRVISSYSRHPAPVIDTTVTDFMKLLNANSYQKGAWVLHMLRNQVGDSLFFEGVRNYYAKFKNGNALTDDFVNVMEDVSGSDLEKFFNQWLERADLPRIGVNWSYDRRRGEVTIMISQTQDGEPFEFPVELQLNSEDSSQLVTCHVVGREENFTFKSDRITSITVDPGVKLLYLKD